MNPEELLKQVTELHEGLLEYRKLLSGGKYAKADGLRSSLAELWGEIEEDVAELGVPLYWTAMDRVIPTFQTALSQFDPLFSAVFYDSISHAITSVEMAKGKLKRISKRGLPPTAKPGPPGVQDKKRVFVAHGHDLGYREAVCRLLEKLGIESIVLMEQPGQSMTIIEKLEEYSDVPYAIVIITPDDMGYPASAPQSVRPRARQNVVLELGYFMGRLGRANIAVLHAGDLELPSDISGVLYIPLESDSWKLTLAGELKAAGFEIDLNELHN